MGKTEIQWCDYTFNPWWGCTRISTGCRNCYAEAMAMRFAHDVWGPRARRRFFGEEYWRQPFHWNAAAKGLGERRRVFCGSMCDLFELLPASHPDRAMQDSERKRLFDLVPFTPYLDWLFLTKRPNVITHMVPDAWAARFPSNVWAGVSVENQEAADARVPHLLCVPAQVRFLSCEPLLGPLDLKEYIMLTETNSSRSNLADARGWCYDEWSGGFVGPGIVDSTYAPESGIHWVICGGESGPHFRQMQPPWAFALRDQCAAVQVPFFFKQWGGLTHKSGHRNLDGRTWDEFPDSVEEFD